MTNKSTCSGAIVVPSNLLCFGEDKELRGEEGATAVTNQCSEVTKRMPQPYWQPLYTQRHHQVEGVDVPAAQSTSSAARRACIPCRAKRGFHVNRERSYVPVSGTIF